MLFPSLRRRESRGRYQVFLNGRIFVGSDWRLMVVSVVLITVGALLFVCYTNEIATARIIVGVTAAASVMLLLLCGLSDPGIKPKGQPPSPNAAPHDSIWRERVYRDADGVSHCVRVEQKWCYSCHVYRPYRGVHCRFCDCCVARRDHHCPWTGACIGARNYRSYFALVWLLSVMLVAGFIGGIQSLVQRAIRFSKTAAGTDKSASGFTLALVDTYGLELSLVLVCFAFGMLTISLAIHHSYLVTQNLTSGDVVKDVPENMFTYGSVWANLWVVLTGCREDEDGARGFHGVEVVVENDDAAPALEAAASPTTQQHAALCDGGVSNLVVDVGGDGDGMAGL